MSLFEDPEPRNRPPAPKDLSGMGVSELEEYIAGLEAEIARARGMIEQKRAARRGADDFFKR